MVLTDCSQGFSFPSFYPNVAVGMQCQGPSWGLGDSRVLGGPGWKLPQLRVPPHLLGTCTLHPSLCLDDVITAWMSPPPDPQPKTGLLFSPAEPCFPPLSFFTTCAYLLCVY